MVYLLRPITTNSVPSSSWSPGKLMEVAAGERPQVPQSKVAANHGQAGEAQCEGGGVHGGLTEGSHFLDILNRLGEGTSMPGAITSLSSKEEKKLRNGSWKDSHYFPKPSLKNQRGACHTMEIPLCSLRKTSWLVSSILLEQTAQAAQAGWAPPPPAPAN
jgi:hypothetical protein